MTYPVTPDGSYFVVRGRLWRRSNPSLSEAKRHEYVHQLMDARRALARSAGLNDDQRRKARHKVDAAKVALGERGDVWWTDGTPDYNRKMFANTPYKDWFLSLPDSERHETAEPSLKNSDHVPPKPI